MTVLDAFLNILPHTFRNAKGWINFNCPYCGDTRYRGGFLETGTGFRYRCFNGGCIFNSHPTGWEDGSPVGGRVKLLFQLLGGKITDLPLSSLVSRETRLRPEDAAKIKPTFNYPSVDLPKQSMNVLDLPPENPVFKYLLSRGEEVASSWEYLWSPEMPHHLIIPFLHRDKIVGWTARDVRKTKGPKFSGISPPDYIFNIDTVKTSTRMIIVVEGVMDAIAISGLATRNATPSKVQIETLNNCGSVPILLPDWEEEGMSYIDVAKRNGWMVSIPDWDSGVKDACEAVRRYGKLYTIETIIGGASNNYDRAYLSIKARSIKI